MSILTIAIFVNSCIKKQEDPNHIVIWEMEDAYIAPFIDSLINDFIKYYESKNNIKIKFTRAHYQVEDLRQQFQAASLAGVPPDLMISPSDVAGIYAIAGFIKNVEKDFDISKYNRPVIEAITLEGKVWGIPISNGNHLMLMYNTKYIKNPPKTTEELFNLCEEFKKSKKFLYCLAFDGGEPFWLMPWLGSFGGWPLEDRKPTLNTQAMIETLKFYYDLKFKLKYIPPECDYNCMDSLFKEEKVPFIINGDWSISGYINHFKDNFMIAVLPKNSKTSLYPTPMISGKYFIISSKVSGKKFQIIKDFIEYYTNKENQIKQFKELKRLPALTEAAYSKEITSDKIAKISMEQILKGKPMPMAWEMRAIWDTLRNYQGLVMTNKITVEEAVIKIQKEVERKIEEMDR
ncbi:MAG: extracellular solute-binding protein [Elusimicrobiales bacterium]|nr:extracellular solute-binding protein [Elusimicrobiales bacterium]